MKVAEFAHKIKNKISLKYTFICYIHGWRVLAVWEHAQQSGIYDMLSSKTL